MSWNNIIGQHRAKKIIQAVINNNRLPHALLFYGPEGVGKDAIAIQLAKILNCQVGKNDSCGDCPDCRKMETLQHPNLHLVFPLPVGKNEISDDSPTAKLSTEDVAQIQKQISEKAKNHYHKIIIERANIIKITSIRDIRKKSSLSVFQKGRKVFIILNAEKLNDQAANALLKTLEEPSGNSLIILTTSNKDSLLPTIISRCQLVRFEELTENEIKNALQINYNINEQQSTMVSKLSDGSFSKAIELINTDLNDQRIKLLEFLIIILSKNIRDISSEVDRISKEYNRQEVEQLLLLMQIWFRDTLALSNGSDSLLNIDLRSRLDKFVARYPDIDYFEILNSIDQSLSLLKKNVYIPLIMFVLVIKLRSVMIGNKVDI